VPTAIGKQAIVVGAGMGGLTAARALADYFERVLVLERDALPKQAEARAGTPQAKHVHALLGGGQRALSELFPRVEHDLIKAGAVPVRVGLDIRMERPGYDPFPQRDLGWDAYAQSRALIEFTVRARVSAHANVALRDRCRVEALIGSADGGAVSGVRWVEPDRSRVSLDADLVIDASGRGDVTLALLESLGLPRPEATTIGVDIAYATATFAIPDDAPPDWKGVFSFPASPKSSRGSLLLPLEGRQWIVTVAGRHGDNPPGDEAGFLAFTRELRTPTINDAIKRAKRLGDIARFRFPESVFRHYEALEAFPRGLLVLGDALCRFNPIYGQGMSVAAMEALALSRLLATRAGERDPLAGLARSFFTEASTLIDTPWTQAAIPDFLHPQTRGQRPSGFEQMLNFGLALTKLAASDPAVHKLTAEVQHLLRPRSAYMDPALVQRVSALTTAP
jgi:2-polyprenyl-6-methoxyphenol hydroxylase-like FAD-dependent oxidoreductase